MALIWPSPLTGRSKTIIYLSTYFDELQKSRRKKNKQTNKHNFNYTVWAPMSSFWLRAAPFHSEISNHDRKTTRLQRLTFNYLQLLLICRSLFIQYHLFCNREISWSVKQPINHSLNKSVNQINLKIACKASTNEFLYFVHFAVPMEVFPWEIWVAFPKESQLQQSRATQPQLSMKCTLGLFMFP